MVFFTIKAIMRTSRKKVDNHKWFTLNVNVI